MAEKEYIEKGELLKTFREGYELPIAPGVATAYWTRVVQIKDALIEFVEKTPPADVVEVVHAAWDEDEYPFCNVCMECGLVIDRTCIKRNSGKLNFCPNCGAMMVGERYAKKTD